MFEQKFTWLVLNFINANKIWYVLTENLVDWNYIWLARQKFSFSKEIWLVEPKIYYSTQHWLV